MGTAKMRNLLHLQLNTSGVTVSASALRDIRVQVHGRRAHPVPGRRVGEAAGEEDPDAVRLQLELPLLRRARAMGTSECTESVGRRTTRKYLSQ